MRRKSSLSVQDLTVAEAEAKNDIEFEAIYEETVEAVRYKKASKISGEMIGEKALLLVGPFVLQFMVKAVMPSDMESTAAVGGIYVGAEVLVDVGLVSVLARVLIPVLSVPVPSLFNSDGLHQVFSVAFAVNMMACFSTAAFKVSQNK